MELGCSSGAQILALARRHPSTRFIGVDYSETELSTASAHTNGLSNVEWVCANVLDWGTPCENRLFNLSMDFLTTVPEPVRLGLLSVVREWLTECGVAFFSHATPPGSVTVLARQVFEKMRAHLTALSSKSLSRPKSA